MAIVIPIRKKGRRMRNQLLHNKKLLAELYKTRTVKEVGLVTGSSGEVVRRALHMHKIPVRGPGARTGDDLIKRAVNRIKKEIAKHPKSDRGKILEGLNLVGLLTINNI